MMNLLGSHDTYRISEIAKDKLAELKLAILFQFTYIGTPHIYYGDEIAMQGAKDPDNRRPFDWHWYNHLKSVELHDFYKELIALRKSHFSLQKGLIRFIEHPQLLIYERNLESSKVLVLINNSDEQVDYHLDHPTSRILYTTFNSDTIQNDNIMCLPPKSGVVVSVG